MGGVGLRTYSLTQIWVTRDSCATDVRLARGWTVATQTEWSLRTLLSCLRVGKDGSTAKRSGGLGKEARLLWEVVREGRDYGQVVPAWRKEQVTGVQTKLGSI